MCLSSFASICPFYCHPTEIESVYIGYRIFSVSFFSVQFVQYVQKITHLICYCSLKALLEGSAKRITQKTSNFHPSENKQVVVKASCFLNQSHSDSDPRLNCVTSG